MLGADVGALVGKVVGGALMVGENVAGVGTLLIVGKRVGDEVGDLLGAGAGDDVG